MSSLSAAPAIASAAKILFASRVASRVRGFEPGAHEFEKKRSSARNETLQQSGKKTIITSEVRDRFSISSYTLALKDSVDLAASFSRSMSSDLMTQGPRRRHAQLDVAMPKVQFQISS